jgi:TRAP-type mannitol/chloroaromatic compound transport system substrate-binding protein
VTGTRSARRSFIAGATVATGTLAAPAVAQGEAPLVEWRLASSFPRGLDTIFGGADLLAKRVAELTANRFRVKVHAAGELIGPFAVTEAVEKGTVEVAHTAPYYFVGRNTAFAFETTLPFGLNQRQQNAWIMYGDGGRLIGDFMRQFGIVSFPGGNTGTQMGGWFKNPLRSPLDLKGLKFRTAGLGATIMGALGVEPKQLAGGEIAAAFASGMIDAAEWVGPYDDEKLGLNKVAQYYYFPGWWESNTMLSFFVNAKEWEKLPQLYKHAFRSAASEVNVDMMAKYDYLNLGALERLLDSGTKLVPFPPEIMRLAQKVSFEFYEIEASKNPAFGKLYRNWKAFREREFAWHRVAEHSYANFVYTTRVQR